MPTEQSLETGKSVLAANCLRSEMSAIVFDMGKLHGKTTRTIRSAAKSYRGLIELEKSISELVMLPPIGPRMFSDIASQGKHLGTLQFAALLQSFSSHPSLY